ncbi:hypothetical protein Rsub_13018 [Raphidocelis subcapitata]|uniref:Scaffold protein Nfu/NifU N-terminal domain-containing protein n=1 Tax=Raphidocelis subcapitata TaxID=307507 RepID=A0A2V0PQ64_9CHLO|nr:hypothetical protein Rsub_13018 [Raphidocelis subcapitata]|eukprot:GBG00201.1 hypothetical protein Rsub_13018 [Raphidocelis subcapitata]
MRSGALRLAAAACRGALAEQQRGLATATALPWRLAGWQQQPSHHPRPAAGWPAPAAAAAARQGWQLQAARGMFIQTQPTPNPQSLMFVPGRPVMEVGLLGLLGLRLLRLGRRCCNQPPLLQLLLLLGLGLGLLGLGLLGLGLLGLGLLQPAAAAAEAAATDAAAATAPPPPPLLLPSCSGSYEFSNARAAMASPLAKRLFAIDGVTGVFFGSDFVTVTKTDDAAWPVLKPLVFAALMDHFASGEALLSDAAALAASDTAIHPDDDEARARGGEGGGGCVVAMIKELLETRIRPAVQEDGGDIVYRGFDVDSGTGACSGCPSSAVTLKSGIENMLMHYIPEVKQVVEAPPDEAEEEGIKAFSKLEQHLSN